MFSCFGTVGVGCIAMVVCFMFQVSRCLLPEMVASLRLRVESKVVLVIG